MIQRLKPWVLPLAMLIGILAHNWIGMLEPFAPVLIFVMLFITFCKLKPSEIRFTRYSLILGGVQLLFALLLYLLIAPVDRTIAQGVFICIFCPVATAAPVITGMLGGNVGRLAAFTLVSNLIVAIGAPVIFPYIGTGQTSPEFSEAFMLVARRIGPLVIAPLVIAMTMRKFTPRATAYVAGHQALSFYIWAISLTIVVGTSVSFAMHEPSSLIYRMLALAFSAGLVCVIQFYAGRRIGRKLGDPVSGAQGMAQKNTVMAIWMSLNWLDPLSSIAPAAYIAWQNTVNSLQIYFKERRTRVVPLNKVID